MRLNKGLLLIASLGMLSGCAGMQDQNGGFSIRSVAAGIANSANPNPQSEPPPTDGQWHSGVRDFHRIENSQSETTQPVVRARHGEKRTLADLARENGMPPPPGSYSARSGRPKRIARHVKDGAAHRPKRRAIHAISKVGAADMSVVHRAASSGKYEASGKPIPVDLN